MFEEKINYAPGPMNVDQGQQVFAEDEPSSLPSHCQRANESIKANQTWRGQTSDSEGESVAQLMESDNELSTNSPPRGILVGKLKARDNAGNEHVSEGQGPMEVVNEVPKAWNGESVSLAPIENVSEYTYLELDIDLYL